LHKGILQIIGVEVGKGLDLGRQKGVLGRHRDSGDGDGDEAQATCSGDGRLRQRARAWTTGGSGDVLELGRREAQARLWI
jgi:hypothetical protein